MKVKAKGQLKHRFWGEYSASIVLLFPTESDASLALAKMGSGWAIASKTKQALHWCGNSEELEKCKDVLESFGADRNKIDSCSKSIDHGEVFEIIMEIDNSLQMNMF